MSRTKPKPKIKTIPWDSAAYLKSDEDIAHYLEAVFEDGDPNLVAAALGDVARAKGMSQIAQAAGLGRFSLGAVVGPNPHIFRVRGVFVYDQGKIDLSPAS